MNQALALLIAGSFVFSDNSHFAEGKCVEKLFAGASHTCAKLANGNAKCWGNGDNGRLGQGDTSNRGDLPYQMGENLTVIDFGLGRKVNELGLGNKQTCAVLDDGTVKCFGGNDSGQLGYEDTLDRGDSLASLGNNLLAVNLGLNAIATAVVGGFSHTCVILNSVSVKCFGDNSSGQLGYGDTANRGNSSGTMGDNLPVVDLGTGVIPSIISAGDLHNCILASTEEIKCWGSNVYGQLGYGDTENRGDEAGEMGNSLLFIDIASSRKAKQLSVGDFHTCVLTDIPDIVCWGYGLNGRLGTGSSSNVGNLPGQMGANLVPVNLGTPTASSLSCGGAHCCVILNTKEIKCWGENLFGRLGLGDSMPRGMSPTELGDSLPTTYLGFTLLTKQILAAGTHSCSLIEDSNDVKCWGNGIAGRLGYGDTRHFGNKQSQMGLFGLD